MSKKHSLYEELKSYIDDYILHLENINEKRLTAATREVNFCRQEALAFNLLRKNIKNLEDNGIS